MAGHNGKICSLWQDLATLFTAGLNLDIFHSKMKNMNVGYRKKCLDSSEENIQLYFFRVGSSFIILKKIWQQNPGSKCLEISLAM